MKTIQLSAFLSRSAGGIFEIQLALSKELAARGLGVNAFGLWDAHWKDDCNRWAVITARVFPIRGPRFFGYSPALRDSILSADADIVHLHHMWMYPSKLVSSWARLTRKRYLVSPNGMLEPWALANSRWKKQLAGFTYENRMLRGAACLHANTAKEKNDFRLYGLKNPVCVIPNGVELPLQSVALDQQSERKILLFLGRLHPKKGLSHALRAWKDFQSQLVGKDKQEEWQFVIAGWDQCGHEAELNALCQEIGLSRATIPVDQFLAGAASTDFPASVVFAGPTFGSQKDQLLRAASAFILPSFSEGLPMSVLEAWAYRLPVLMTDHCNLPEGFAAGAAVRIGTEVESITDGLHEMISATNPQRQLMGDCGRALVERQFTWPQVAAQMKEVYDWVLGGGAKPSCVE